MKISILGTGVIGSAITEALLKAGNDVIVYNRTSSKTEPLVKLGAIAVSTAKQAIEESDTIVLAVYGGEILREVLLNDNVKTLLNGKKLLTVATSEAEEIKAISSEISLLGGNLSELAIMSSAVEVKAKQGYALLGCEKTYELFWKEVMEAIGDIVYVGEVGSPAIASIPLIIGEALRNLHQAYSVAFAIKMNIPQEVIARDASMFIPGSEEVVPALFSRDYSKGMATLEGYKDTIEIAYNALKSAGLPIKIFEDILKLYDKAIKLGFADKAESALMEALLD